MDKNKQLEQRNELSGVFTKSLLTGFIGGMLWSVFGVILYFFKFSEVAPKTFLLRSWLTAEWTNSWLGDVISILGVGVISILTAIIYYFVFKKINVMWTGIIYGALLWGIIFYVLQPVFSNVPRLADLQLKTIVSTICLFILYGGFIGYSISFDYHSMKIKLKHQKQQDSNIVRSK